jgi:5,10-methylene-tetrahydrofolate dehydrogenase/methenyl tetrahydrofolate cyclohydrolase
MPAALMDGRAAAQLVKDGLRAEVQRLGAAAPPGLAVVLVGSKLDAEAYLSMLRRACADVGVVPVWTLLPERATALEVRCPGTLAPPRAPKTGA